MPSGASDRPPDATKAPPPLAPVAPLAKRPSISVVIAAYQVADTIAAAIDSVLEQTVPADEIVVCDDGSTDGTAAALEPYRDRVRVIRQENSGVAAAKNAAARAASSEFVLILDADDLFMPRRIEVIAELARVRPDLDVITTDVVAELDGRPVGRQSEHQPFPVDVEGQRAEILRHSYISCPAVRRERLLAVGGFEETLRIGSDWHCWIKLVLDGCLIGLVDEPLYRYQLGLGTVASNPAANHRANVDILGRVRQDARLSDAERRIVEHGIAIHRREAALLEARQGILAGSAGARRAAIQIALGRGFPLRSRAKACLSALAPGLARRSIERGLEGAPAYGLDVMHR